MKTISQLIRVSSLLAFLVFGLIFSGTINHTLSYAQSACSPPAMQQRMAFVQSHLLSLADGQFALFDDNGVELNISGISNVLLPGMGLISLPIKRTPSSVEYWSVDLTRKNNLRASNFEAVLRPYNTSVTLPNSAAAYEGYVKDQGKNNSLAVLYVRFRTSSSDPDAQGFISGFVLGHDPLKNQDRAGWYFIEPIRPLLKLANAPQGEMDNFFPSACRTHVVYRTVDTDFHIVLDPPKGLTLRPFQPLQKGRRPAPASLQTPSKLLPTQPDFTIDFDFPIRVKAGSDVPVKAKVRNNRETSATVSIALNVMPLPGTGKTVSPEGRPFEVLPSVRLKPGESMSILLPYTFKTTGDYSVEVLISESGSLQARDTQWIMVKESVTPEEILDVNNDNRRDDIEVLNAIAAWTQNQPLPGSGSGSDGIMLDDADMLHLMEKWIQEKPYVDAQPKPFFSITVVGDQQFYDLSTPGPDNEKEWWQRQEEVMNLVDSLFAAQTGTRMKLKAMEVWRESNWFSYPSGTPTAMDLLCSFIEPQFTPNEPMHRFHEHIDADVVHLMTGQSLGRMGKNDGGDDFCPNPATCGNSIVGLAESIGGLQRPTKMACASDNGGGFFAPAKHSVSQHQILPNLKDPSCDSGSVCDTRNYDTLLYQRFLLVAHELGHSFNAIHTDIYEEACYLIVGCVTIGKEGGVPITGHGIMKPGLNQTIIFNFGLSSEPRIRDCAAGVNCIPPTGN